MHFRNGIRVLKQRGYRGGVGRRGHPGAIADIGSGKADAREMRGGFHLHRVQGDAVTSGLAVKIVAVARGQGEHQELAAIDTGALAGVLGGNGQRPRVIPGAHCNQVFATGVLDDR